MSDASYEDQALPSYGQNGRDLILKAARELESKASKKPREQSPVAEPQTDFDDNAYVSAVPPANRPTIAYNPRGKIPRVVRQAGLTRFVAHRLRLAARAVPHGQKLNFVAQQHVWSAAIQDATVQEAALFKRAANKQVLYSNLLARAKAEELDNPAQPAVQSAAEAIMPGPEPRTEHKEEVDSVRAEVADVGPAPRCDGLPQHSLKAGEDEATDATGTDAQHWPTGSPVHAGSKRKHAEAPIDVDVS